MSKTVLYGASGHAKVVLDALELNGIKDIKLIDDNPEITRLGTYKVFAFDTQYIDSDSKVIISIGNNKIRQKLVNRVESTFCSIVHPNVIIASSVSLGTGTFVAAGAVINSDTLIGNHVIINTSASIDHDCKVDDFAHIAPNATLCGGVSVGEGTLVGAGSTIIPNISIGKWATIGAGSVITSNIPDNALVVGNPGRIVRIDE